MGDQYRYSSIYISWMAWERAWRDFSGALYCLATGLGWFVGLLTLSWIWASLTAIGVVLLAYNRGLNQLIDRRRASTIMLKAGFATNLVVAPVDFVAARATTQMATGAGAQVLLLSFGVVGVLWFLWKIYRLPYAIAHEREIKRENRSSLVDPDVITIFVAVLALCSALVWGERFTDLRLFQGIIGVLSGFWVATGSAFLWVTLRRGA